jgi:hypothetical protein
MMVVPDEMAVIMPDEEPMEAMAGLLLAQSPPLNTSVYVIN